MRLPGIFRFGILFLVLIHTGFKDLNAMELGDLSTSRRVDWSRAGYPGDIPDVSESIVTVTGYGVTGDGVADDHAAIQALIDNTSAPAVLYFPAGSYRIGSALDLKANIVLRGDGSSATHLDFYSDNGCFNIRGTGIGSFVSIVSGLEKGSRQIVVSDAAGFQAGTGGMIRQEDIDAVDPSGEWAASSWVPDHVVGQMVNITEVNGNTLTMDPPLHMDFSPDKNPEIQRVNFIRGVGIEYMHINRINTGTITTNTIIDRAAECWIRAVDSDFTQKYHISISRSLNIEIQECYIHDALSKGDGGQGYGASLNWYTTSTLVENCIFNELRHSMIIQLGVNGCVFGYNYARRNYSDDGWDKTYISVHGHYPYMNLFESNVVGQIGIADYWGASGPGNTLFRNMAIGTDRHKDFGPYRGISVDDYSHKQNIIGNELVGGLTEITFDGYTDSIQGTSEDIIVHGNNIHGNTAWSALFSDQLLPSSFYLSSKPEFYGAMDWPSIGGDKELGTGSIPAEERYINGDYVPQPAIDDPPADEDPPAGDDPQADDDTPPDEDPSPGVSGNSSGGGCFISSFLCDQF